MRGSWESDWLKAPFCTTTRLSAEPVRSKLAAMPRPKPTMATKTATTAAMPSTVRPVRDLLWSRLRRLYFSGIAMALVHEAEGLDDPRAGGAQARPGGAQPPHAERDRHPE